MRPFKDANSEIDYGNIDIFYIEDGVCHLEGAWGAVEVVADSVFVMLL
jgi:hypothetical protein